MSDLRQRARELSEETYSQVCNSFDPAKEMAAWAETLLRFVRERETELCISLRGHADHVEQNASALTKYGFMDDEARCRLLSALHLREAASCIEQQQKLQDLDAAIRVAALSAQGEGNKNVAR